MFYRLHFFVVSYGILSGIFPVLTFWFLAFSTFYTKKGLPGYGKSFISSFIINTDYLPACIMAA